MANLPVSYLTILRGWSEVRGNQKVVVAKVTVPKADATAYGDSATNPIPASVFGMQKIEEVTPIITTISAINVIVASPSSDGTKLLTFNIKDAADATRADVSPEVKRIDASNDGVFYFTVRGY